MAKIERPSTLGIVEGLNKKSQLRRRDGQIIPQSPIASTPKLTLQSINVRSVACACCSRRPLRRTTYVARPGSQALSLCFRCWREAMAREASEIVRQRFNDLFVRLRPRFIAGGALIVFFVAAIFDQLVRHSTRRQRESGAVKEGKQFKLQTVTRKMPCLVCGKPDWCGITEDGSLAVCMRVSDGSIRESGNNGFVHILKERVRNDWQHSVHQPVIEKPKPSIAPIDRRHTVYAALLDALELSVHHGSNLEQRGLSDTEIARLLFASVPNDMSAMALCAELSKRFDLSGVPGFFRENERWQMAFAGLSGFFVPVRDVQGRIQASQIRFDQGDVRYRWFSSKDRSNGASSGAPVHFARTWRCVSTGEAIITEGALKADIIAEQLDCCVVAVPGVANFKEDFGEWLRAQLPALRSVYIALDSDWHTKPEVERALLRLFASVEKAGLAGQFLDWEGAKGLDDLLSEGVTA